MCTARWESAGRQGLSPGGTPPSTVADSRGCTVGTSKGGGHRDSAGGPQAPPQVLGKQRTQPGGAPPRPLRDLKGTEGQVVGGIHLVLEEKQPLNRSDFKALSLSTPSFQTSLKNCRIGTPPPHPPTPLTRPPYPQAASRVCGKL